MQVLHPIVVWNYELDLPDTTLVKRLAGDLDISASRDRILLFPHAVFWPQPSVCAEI